VRLFLITRSRTAKSPTLPQTPREPAPTILPPKRTAPLLPLAIRELFNTSYTANPKTQSILKALRSKQNYYKRITLAECRELDRYLYYRDRLYVPDSLELYAELLKMYYKSPVTGHIGRA
jgi:hypothetical protein